MLTIASGEFLDDSGNQVALAAIPIVIALSAYLSVIRAGFYKNPETRQYGCAISCVDFLLVSSFLCLLYWLMIELYGFPAKQIESTAWTTRNIGIYFLAIATFFMCALHGIEWVLLIVRLRKRNQSVFNVFQWITCRFSKENGKRRRHYTFRGECQKSDNLDTRYEYTVTLTKTTDKKGKGDG